MAKVIKYKFLSCEVNHGTEKEPNMEQIILSAEIICKTQEQFDANYPIAEKEAVPGSIEVTGEFEHGQDNATTDDVLNALLGVNRYE